MHAGSAGSDTRAKAGWEAGLLSGLASCDGTLWDMKRTAAAERCDADSVMQFSVAQQQNSGAVGLRKSRAAEVRPILFSQANDQGPAVGVSGDFPKGHAEASFGAFDWVLPPLRWGGSLVSDVRAQKGTDQVRRLQQNEITNIRASSYVWQPWFAQVSGGLGALLSRERLGEGTNQTANEAGRNTSTAITGDGAVTLFPVSRFPFNAYFSVSDSRASGELATNDFRNTRFGARQSYRPLEGNTSYSANFDRSTLSSLAFGRDTVDALAASMNRTVGPRAFNIFGSHTRNTRSNTGERTGLSQLTARHSYRPEPEWSMESLASWTSSDFHLLSGGLPFDRRSHVAQANPIVTWGPEEASPLYVTGGGRMFRARIASSVGETESLTLGGNIGATYALSRQTLLSGSASATQLLSDDRNTFLTTQAASATHIGDPVGIFGGIYTWNTGANVANQTGAVEGTRQNIGAQIGHNFSYSLLLGEGSQLILGLGQGITTNFDTDTAQSQTLSHNGSLSWRLSRNGTTSAYLGLLAADARTSGYNANEFQMINFQASGQVQFDRNSSAAANLTVQGVRQSTNSTPSAGFSLNASGTLSYFHVRVFDVPRLRYTALYGINESQFRTRLQGDVDAPRERVTQSFEQRFDYNVGRVAMRLSMRIADIEGRRDALLFFRLAREFGAF
ncbi:MAG: hypothetical protein ACT4P8_13615 [Betaproteobacteria bacterium]